MRYPKACSVYSYFKTEKQFSAIKYESVGNETFSSEWTVQTRGKKPHEIQRQAHVKRGNTFHDNNYLQQQSIMADSGPQSYC